MISTDRSVFDGDSAVRARLVEQASLISELHVVVLTPKGEKYKKLHIGRQLSVYPTVSMSKFGYLSDAYKIGKEILKKGEGGGKRV